MKNRLKELADCYRRNGGNVTEMIELFESEIEQLQEIIGPFAALASGIPDNWPGYCRLRIDTRRDQSEFLNYHGVPEEHLGVLPTIDQWRAVAKAAADAAKGE